MARQWYVLLASIFICAETDVKLSGKVLFRCWIPQMQVDRATHILLRGHVQSGINKIKNWKCWPYTFHPCKSLSLQNFIWKSPAVWMRCLCAIWSLTNDFRHIIRICAGLEVSFHMSRCSTNERSQHYWIRQGNMVCLVRLIRPRSVSVSADYTFQ